MYAWTTLLLTGPRQLNPWTTLLNPWATLLLTGPRQLDCCATLLLPRVASWHACARGFDFGRGFVFDLQLALA